MKCNTDKPINDKKDDLLGRKTFSKYLGKAIYEHNQEAGLVIGLYGKWGTGKTSVINMAENEIKKLAKKDGNEPLIIKFSPWNYSNKSDLIYTFLKSLENELEIQADEETKKYKIGKFLSDYTEAFSVVKFIPFVGTIIEPVAKTAIKVQGENLTQVPDLEGTKDKLVQELKDLKNKIIVVIDDIDRLTSSQIRDIFQLVKQVADFPNIVYVLVMDKEVVCSALEKVHNMDGNEYLEKIVQVPFEIPETIKDNLYSILRDRINKIVNGHVSNEEYYASILRNCVEPYINTMRDINRLINIFQFKYEALNKETLPEDLLAITTLEVLESKLYKWIYDNKGFVCGDKEYVLVALEKEKLGYDHNYYRDKYYGELKDIGINPDIAVDCVATLFSSFAKIIGKYRHIGVPSTEGIKEKMRIAGLEKFETYFVFDLDNIKDSKHK
jgi:P-loop ATPase